MKKEIWIIVANSTHARLFTVDGATLKEHDALVHPECRMHEKDLVSDRPGVGIEMKTSPKKNEMILFARQIADLIEKARNDGKLDRLFLTASPELLGLLRGEFSPQTADLIAFQGDKDLTHCKPKEVYQWYNDLKF